MNLKLHAMACGFYVVKFQHVVFVKSEKNKNAFQKKVIPS